MSNEAFDIWLKENYLVDMSEFIVDEQERTYIKENNLLRKAWQAAKADSEQEIAMLKVRVGDVTQAYQEKVNELQAHINDLREALEENHYCNSSEKAINLYNVAISKPPAQSLQKHDNEVIEKCAMVCDAWSLIGKSIAHDVRTLKG